MILPNVVIAGAPKCGTSSVFEWLSAHPQVCVSSKKETGFFLDARPSSGRRGEDRGLESYGRFFAHCDGKPGIRVILEATPDYFDQETAIAAVPKLPTAPKIVFLLRRPAARIYSSYQFFRNNLSILPREMTFQEFVGLAEGGGDGEAAIASRAIFEQTRYATHLSKWLASAGGDRVCIFLFEELRDDPAGFMRRLSSRIGIEVGFWDEFDFKTINAGYRVKSQGVHRVVRRITAAAPCLVRNDFLKKAYGLANKEKTQGIAREDLGIMAKIDDLFRPHNDELEKLAGIDLSCWR